MVGLGEFLLLGAALGWIVLGAPAAAWASGAFGERRASDL